MKTWIQFHHKSAIGDELIPACGDRAVIILDGRVRSDTHHAIAEEECRKRGYKAYQLHKSERFRDSPISPLVKVQYSVLDWKTTYVDEVEELKVEYAKLGQEQREATLSNLLDLANFYSVCKNKVGKKLQEEHGLWIL